MFSESLNQSSTIHPPSQRTSLLPALPAFIGGGGLKIETARCWKFKRFMVCASFVYATLGVKTLEEIPGASSVVEWRLLCGCGTTGKNPSHSGSLFGCLFSAIFRIHHKLKGERCQKKEAFFWWKLFETQWQLSTNHLCSDATPGRALGGGRNL